MLYIARTRMYHLEVFTTNKCMLLLLLFLKVFCFTCVQLYIQQHITSLPLVCLPDSNWLSSVASSNASIAVYRVLTRYFGM